MFHADSLVGIRIGPAGDIARGINIGDARFEKSIQQDTAIERKAGLFGQRQTWSDPDTNNHEFRFNYAAAFEPRALAVDSNHGIFKMKHDPVLLVQRTNEITYFEPEDALHWPLFRRHDVHLDFARAQRCRHLKSNKTCTDHEHAARLSRRVNDGAAIGERTQRMNMWLVGARNRQAYRLRAGGQQKPIVGHVATPGGDDMARFDINADDLAIEAQVNAGFAVVTVRTQRHPVLGGTSGKIVLGQVR